MASSTMESDEEFIIVSSSAQTFLASLGAIQDPFLKRFVNHIKEYNLAENNFVFDLSDFSVVAGILHDFLDTSAEIRGFVKTFTKDDRDEEDNSDNDESLVEICVRVIVERVAELQPYGPLRTRSAKTLLVFVME